jgi:hypothetical protein
METKDEFHMQMAGSIIAIRIVIAALMKTHPHPEMLLQEIQSLISSQPTLEGNLPAPIQAAFDERLSEFTSHLYQRINQ